MQQRLLEIGEWLKVNGEAIYGTKPWRVAEEGKQVRYTTKDGAVYAIVLTWPKGELVLSSAKVKGDVRVALLGHKEPLKCSVVDGKLRIEVPALSVDEVPCRHAYVFKLTGVE
jgi:alpha-L-fucosidase